MDKYFLKFAESLEEDYWKSLPTNIKKMTLELVDKLSAYNLTTQEQLNVLMQMPAEFAMDVVYKMPKEESVKLIKILYTKYVDEFKKNIEKTNKSGNTDFDKDCNTTRFVKNLREGKKTRYVSAYELIMIWQGLGYNAFDLIKKYEGDERYKNIIHSKFKSKRSNSTEYRMLQSNMEQIYVSALNNVDKIIASQKYVT